MRAVLKTIGGLILIIIGLGLFVDSVVPIITPLWKGTGPFLGIDWLANFITMLTGVIPIFLILIGIFVVWLELDEMKAEKELKRIEEKSKAEKEKKK